MKKFALAAALYPITVIVGWIATKFSERWWVALSELDYEFGFDDDYPVPDPLTVLNRTEV